MNYWISKADFIINFIIKMERLIFNFVRNCKRIINEIKWIDLSRAEWKKKVIQERYQSEIYGKSSIAMCIAFCGNSSGCTRYIEVRRYLRDDAFFHSHGRRKTHRLLAGVQVWSEVHRAFSKNVITDVCTANLRFIWWIRGNIIAQCVRAAFTC